MDKLFFQYPKTDLLPGLSQLKMSGTSVGYSGSTKERYQKKFEKIRKSAFENLIHAPVAFARFDLEMNYLFATERWIKDYQVSEKKLIGKNYYKVFPNIPSRWREIHERALSGEVIKGREEAYLRTDGRTDYVNWIVMPWRDLENRICGIDILSEVVTSRIETQKEVERLKAELGRLVAEKTLQLEELLEKEKELNRIKSDLMAIASHELRTPAGIILSTCYLIAHYHKNGQLVKNKLDGLVTILEGAAIDLKLTLENFLSSESIRSGLISTHAESIDIGNSLSSICREIKVKLKKRQRIICDPCSIPPLLLDPVLFRHILWNLISNAIKFSPPNSIVRVTTQLKKNQLQINIIDQGIGIDQGDKKHLFKQYFRGKNSHHYPGTGMGLFIVHRFAEMLNGKITFRSKRGLGSRFTFTISKIKYEKNSGH